MVGKRKASTFTDDERADAVALLHLRGWPDNKGALTAVSKHLNIWANTLRRWANGESNPPPNKFVIRKKADLKEAILELLGLTINQARREVGDASFRETSTAIGIFTDKLLLLSGEPTQRTAAEHTHHVTENVDRSEYDDLIREAESIINQTTSSI